MRRKMARAVEGCLYNFINTVPGSDSKYSKLRRDEVDIVTEKGLPVTIPLHRDLQLSGPVGRTSGIVI